MEGKDSIKVLKAKIRDLENELEVTKSSQRQIMDENSIECHDERRFFMLKSQVFQLERQCMLFSKSLSSRENVLQEIENQVVKLILDFQHLLAKDIKGPSVPVSKSQIMSTIEILQELKGSLFRQTTYESSDDIQNPLTTSLKFAKHDLNCMDVCNVNFRHINMTEVSNLEGKLQILFKACSHLKLKLQSMLHEHSKFISNAVHNSLIELIEENCALLNETCSDLLRLSMLYPNNPKHNNNTVRNKADFFLLRSADIINSIKPISPKAKNVITAMSNVHSYFLKMTQLEIEALNLEINYHRHTKRIQYEYAENIITVVSNGYDESGKKLIENIELPITEIMSAWTTMKTNQNEDTFRSFLECMKTNEVCLKSLAELSKSQGINTIYDFKQKLDAKINKLKEKFDKDFEEIKTRTAQFKQSNFSCIELLQRLTINT